MLSAKVCRHRECWAFFIAHKLIFVVDWTVLRLCRGRRLPCVVVFRTPSTYRPVGDLSWGITTFCLGCVCATRHGPGIVYLYDHSVALWTSSRAKPLIGLRKDSASCWPEKVQFTRLSWLTGTCVLTRVVVTKERKKHFTQINVEQTVSVRWLPQPQ